VRHWQAGEFSARRLGWGWMPPHPTLYLRREWYERVGRFDTGFRIAADYDFVLRLFSNPGLAVGYVPEVLVKMRLGGASNRSLRNVLTKSSEDLRALRNARVGGLGALAWKNLSKIGQFAG
jgi:glycosyltransferase